MKDMEYKSQNNEVEIVMRYFNGFIGNLLDLGANDGVTFSNSYDLIHSGWRAVLVEPVYECAQRIIELYRSNSKVRIINSAVGNETKIGDMFIPADSLLSTYDLVNAQPNSLINQVQFYSFEDLLETALINNVDFITIDCEGMDWIILQQINLSELDCKCLCIEHSGRINDIKEYCAKHGLHKELLRNGENIILAK